MLTHNRPRLVKDLNETALGLIEQAEFSTPEQARELVELASTLDRLRVSMLQNCSRPVTCTTYTSLVPANCA